MTNEWFVYNSNGAYVGRCVHAEDAAALLAVAGNGNGAVIRHALRTVWTEGGEIDADTGKPIPAADSYDYVASVCHGRIKTAAGLRVVTVAAAVLAAAAMAHTAPALAQAGWYNTPYNPTQPAAPWNYAPSYMTSPTPGASPVMGLPSDPGIAPCCSAFSQRPSFVQDPPSASDEER